MNDVSPELLTLGITHDSSLALVLYLCWFIIMPDVKYVGALPFIILNMWPSINCSTLYSIGSSPTSLNSSRSYQLLAPPAECCPF